MDRLIKFELNEMFKRKSFFWCLFFLVIGTVASLLMTGVMNDLVFDTGWDLDGYSCAIDGFSTSNFSLLLGILTSISICSDYSEKTNKNIYSRGFTRLQLFLSKSLSIYLAAIIYCLVPTVVGFIVGSVSGGTGLRYFDTEFIFIILVQIFLALAFASLYIFISFTLKKMATAVVFSVIILSLIETGLTIIQLVLDYKEIDFPIDKIVITTHMVEITYGDTKELIFAFLLSIVYIVGFSVVSYRFMRKDEV